MELEGVVILVNILPRAKIFGFFEKLAEENRKISTTELSMKPTVKVNEHCTNWSSCPVIKKPIVIEDGQVIHIYGRSVPCSYAIESPLEV